MKHVDHFKRIVSSYQNHVDFLTIYTKEAHPTDGWNFPWNKYKLAQHESIEDRIASAKILEELQLGCPIVCDNMKNDISRNFNGWPERLWAIKDGVVVYKGRHGPFGYNTDELEDYLKKVC